MRNLIMMCVLAVAITGSGCADPAGGGDGVADQAAPTLALHDVAASVTVRDGTMESPLVDLGRPVSDVDGAAELLGQFGAGTETCSRSGDTCCTTLDPGWSCCCHVNSGIGTGCDCAPTPQPAPSNPPQTPFAPAPAPADAPPARLQQAASIAASGHKAETDSERAMIAGALADLTGTGAQTNDDCVRDPEWGAACCHDDGFSICCCFVTVQGGHLCSCKPKDTTDPGHGGTSPP